MLLLLLSNTCIEPLNNVCGKREVKLGYLSAKDVQFLFLLMASTAIFDKLCIHLAVKNLLLLPKCCLFLNKTEDNIA